MLQPDISFGYPCLSCITSLISKRIDKFIDPTSFHTCQNLIFSMNYTNPIYFVFSWIFFLFIFVCLFFGEGCLFQNDNQLRHLFTNCAMMNASNKV